LQQNPFAAFTCTTNDMVTVRLSGEVIFIDDLALKKKIFEKQPGIQAIYNSADNPVFEVFYIEHGKAIISDFSGKPPRTITF